MTLAADREVALVDLLDRLLAGGASELPSSLEARPS